MKQLLILAVLLAAVQANGQVSGNYANDLARVREVLEKTHSFRDQITGGKLTDYNNQFNKLLLLQPDNRLDYFKNLAKLFQPLRDYHLALYEITDFDKFKTKEAIEGYVRSDEFAAYPHVNLNIDSLKTALSQCAPDSLEGIYFYDRFYSVGLYKSSENEYVGVVLDSKTPLWKPGQIAISITRLTDNSLKAIYGHPRTKSLSMENNEKFRHRSLINSLFYASLSNDVYRKNRDSSDVINLPRNSSRFEMKRLNENIQYLLVRSFQRDSKTVALSKAFVDSIKDSLKSPFLVLDLRNNEGGASGEADRYFQLLKRYKGRLYVITNNGTLSQAEMLLLRLKELKNVTVVGQTTKGMLTYGSNYGTTIILPGGKHKIYPTDMKGEKKHLKYEGVGIHPDIELNSKDPWPEQVVRLINFR